MGRLEPYAGRICWDGVLEPGTVRHHGSHDSTEYKAWREMRSRCWNKYDKKFSEYGEKGVKVCKEWQNCFLTFLDDVGPRPSKHNLSLMEGAKEFNARTCKWAETKRKKKS